MKKQITEKLLIQLYTVENKTVNDIAQEFKISSATINRYLKKYNIKKSEEQRRLAISKTKQAKTDEEKAEYSKHISKARKGKGLGQIPWNKGKQGCQVAWNKGISTGGRPRTAESLEKARQTCLERYGVDWPCQRQEARLRGQDSNANREFAQLLTDNNIEYLREFPIKTYSYDFKVGKYLIEIDPYATHNSTWGIRDNGPKAHNYHKNKSNLAEENNYFCIHVFDWDDKAKIINKFKPMTDIYAEDCKVKSVSRAESKEFLTTYHPQNFTNDIIRLGLYYKDELVEIMTFSKPRFNNKYGWELNRLCAKAGYHVINGSKKLLDSFITQENPVNILVYCDLAKLSGKLYENLGFKRLRYAAPTRHWYNPKTHTHYTDSFLWRKGFDRLFGTDYGKTTNNNKLMLEHGFVEIYDCGQATYVWKKEKLD